MELKALTPYQVAERTKPRSQAKKAVVKRKRSNGLACYTPLGDEQASIRVTGSRLDPDSPEMTTAANHFASGLLDAMRKQGTARSIIGPARYSDRVLGIYCNQMVKGALGAPQDFTTSGPVSPVLVPYLLGGITTKAVEDLCYRALEVMDFVPSPLEEYTLQKSLSNVGFGEGIRHEAVEIETPKKYNHLSQRQDFLLNLPRGVSYARLLIKDGAYGESLHRRLMSWKDLIITETTHAFDPAAGEMTELAAVGRHPVVLTDNNYERAIRRVFEKKWMDLDLTGKADEVVADAEVVMARKIIQRLSYNDRMSAEALVGISLLTGISLACWAEFAVYDLKRRGETFITAETLDEVVYLVSSSPHYKCDHELRGAATELRYANDGNRKWARRLQSPLRPLWSSKGTFYLERYTADGIPKYKHKPFSLTSD